jgi:hypothetical protein
VYSTSENEEERKDKIQKYIEDCIDSYFVELILFYENYKKNPAYFYAKKKISSYIVYDIADEYIGPLTIFKEAIQEKRSSKGGSTRRRRNRMRKRKMTVKRRKRVGGSKKRNRRCLSKKR